MLTNILLMEILNSEAYVSVKMIDIVPGVPLDFDTFMYLPKNNKYIRLSQAGYGLVQNKVQHYYDRNISSLYIKEEDLPKFYNYVAKQFKLMGQENKLSHTERTKKISRSARSIVTLMLSNSTGSANPSLEIMKLCKQVAAEFLDCGNNAKIFNEIMHLKIDGDGLYSHLPNSAAVVTMLAMALGFENVQEIAIAGLLHDIGMSQLDPYLIETPYSDLDFNDKIKYQSHVRLSNKLIKQRGLPVSELVYTIISQHHEQYNGKGYPKKLKGNQICKEAQLLLFADMYDDLTTPKEGKEAMYPKDVIMQFAKSLSKPDDIIIHPNIIKPLVQLFLKEHKVAS